MKPGSNKPKTPRLNLLGLDYQQGNNPSLKEIREICTIDSKCSNQPMSEIQKLQRIETHKKREAARLEIRKSKELAMNKEYEKAHLKPLPPISFAKEEIISNMLTSRNHILKERDTVIEKTVAECEYNFSLLQKKPMKHNLNIDNTNSVQIDKTLETSTNQPSKQVQISLIPFSHRK